MSAQKRRMQPTVPAGLWRLRHAKQVGEGAQEFAFLCTQTLPALSNRGPGIQAGGLAVLETPQVPYFLQVPQAGLGGLVAGQIITAPLQSQGLAGF